MVVALLEWVLVGRMLEVVLEEDFILSYKIKVRHFIGWWDGTDRDYRNVPKASSFPLRYLISCRRVLGPIKEIYATTLPIIYTSQLRTMLIPFFLEV